MDTLFSKRTMNRFVNRAVDASGYTMGILATAVIIIPVVSVVTESVCWCAKRILRVGEGYVNENVEEVKESVQQPADDDAHEYENANDVMFTDES